MRHFIIALTGQILYILAMLKNFVEQFRRREDETKSVLAKKIGVCPSYITRLENFEIQPSGEMMFRFAKHFGCRIEDLFKPE